MKIIDYNTLRRKFDRRDKFLLVNALPRTAFLEEHIEGSVNIPADDKDFVKQVEKKAGSKTGDIVLYCGGVPGTASRKGADLLSRAGFTNVSVYEGGMPDWRTHKGTKAA